MRRDRQSARKFLSQMIFIPICIDNYSYLG